MYCFEFWELTYMNQITIEMVKAAHIESMALRKGLWSPKEDQKLSAYIKRYGIWNWSHMPRAAGLARSGKSCRLRWVNYLRPDIKRGNLSKEDEETVLKWHQVLGNRWTVIAAKLPGRTDNEIKNYWHTHLKKRCNTNSQSTTVLHSVKPSGVDVEANKNDSPGIQDLPLCDAQVSNLPGSKPRGTSPQLLPDYFSSSSNGCAVEIGQRNQTIDETCSPSETFEALQSWWEQPFSVEDMYTMETEPGLIMSPVSTAVWLQETMYSYTSCEDADAGIDLWG